MMKYKMTGLDKMLKNTKKLKMAVASTGTKKALFKEATGIMADSEENYVPVDTGNLRNSGHTDKPKVSGTTASIEFGYGGTAAKYAAWVHEHPRSGKTEGISPSGQRYKHWAHTGGFKFLEIPMNKAKAGMAVRIANTIQREINNAIK